MQSYSGEKELCCVNVPTNHLYIGDIFLINTNDVIRPNLSVREGIGEGSTSFVVKGKKNFGGGGYIFLAYCKLVCLFIGRAPHFLG